MTPPHVLLPPSIARHINLGFDSDDINALISSIDSSQKRATSDHETRLPQLPAEIIVSILHFVPVNYILDWRLVCRGFRDIIDTTVMFSYLQRVELIGYVGPSIRPDYLRDPRSDGGPVIKIISADEFEDVQLLHAHFHGILAHEQTSRECAKRSTASDACYRIDVRWFETFEKIGGSVTDPIHSPIQLRRVINRLELERDEDHPKADYCAVRWCIKLDGCLLDIDSPVAIMSDSAPFLTVDLKDRTINVLWKHTLWQFLRTENSIRKKMDQTQASCYTFGHEEDCLRYVRRIRSRLGLDLTNATDRGCSWALRTLEPLFGKKRNDKAVVTLLLQCLLHGHSWEILEQTEDDSARILMQLRREASATPVQRASSLQLGRDRQAMVREKVELGALFMDWYNNLYCSSRGRSVIHEQSVPRELPPNPFAWPETTRQVVEEEVQRWKAQRKGIEYMKSFMQISNEIMKAPDELWDDLGCD